MRAPWSAVLAASLLASAGLSARRLWWRPAPEQLDALEQRVRAELRPGDGVMMAPDYWLGVRERLGDLPLWQLPALPWDAMGGFTRVHVVELPGAAPFDEARALTTHQRLKEERWGGVRWSLFERRGGERIVFDLWRDLERGRVTLTLQNGEPQRCEQWDRGRWLCLGRPPWNYVGREVLEAGGAVRPCVWVHPMESGGRLRVELPPTSGRRIVGGFGLTPHGARRAQAGVRVRLSAQEQTVANLDLAVSPAWQFFDVAVPPGPLSLDFETSNNHGAHLCMQLHALAPPDA